MNEFLSFSLFSIGENDFSVGQLILTFLLLIGIFFLYRLLLKIFFPRLSEITEVSNAERNKLGKLVRGLAVLCFLLVIIIVVNLDFVFFAGTDYSFSVVRILKALIFLQFARIVFWGVSNIFIHSYYARRDELNEKSKDKSSKPRLDTESSAQSIVQYIFFLLVGIYALQNFNFDPILSQRVIDGETVSFRISNILQAVLIMLIARLIVWVITQLILYNFYTRNKIEVGSQYAINQLIKYVIYVIAIIMALGVFGINMNILLGGAAALLVGIGLGLQQTFNDFVSGIVLLFERSVTVGDVLEVDGEISTVREIGLRASTLETRGSVSIVVPNHKLVNEKVINWNHNSDKVRFVINIGVAYGTDTAMVKKLLLKSVKDNPYVINYPSPFVRFKSFGESSLDFDLFFFSRNLMVIEDVKSDIRLEIDRLLREHGVSIPFPQREVRIIREDNDNNLPTDV